VFGQRRLLTHDHQRGQPRFGSGRGTCVIPWRVVHGPVASWLLPLDPRRLGRLRSGWGDAGGVTGRRGCTIHDRTLPPDARRTPTGRRPVRGRSCHAAGTASAGSRTGASRGASSVGTKGPPPPAAPR